MPVTRADPAIAARIVIAEATATATPFYTGAAVVDSGLDSSGATTP